MPKKGSIFDEIGVNIFIETLSEGHFIDDFDCEHQDTNDFLRDDALYYQTQNLAVTWVVKDKFNKVLGFASLAMAGIVAKPKMEVNGADVRQYPCLKIGRLGVTKEYQGKRIGELLILIAIRKAKELQDTVGCRFVSVDAYPNRIGFYERHGFIQAKSKLSGKTMPMYLLIGES